MEVKNHLKPHKTQIEGFLEGDTDTPITMLNLLKFKEKAEYEDGRETDSIYGKEVVEHLKKVGANWVLSGKVSRLMIGEAEDLWDSVAIARYPSRKAMFEMIMDPDYLESEKHRSAGLEGQLNIELKEGELL
jgi:uncharacterized protein (DUF1330 family)